MSADAPVQIVARHTQEKAQTLLSPAHAEWQSAPEALLPLQPTPLERQPSAYVQKAWEGRARGRIERVSLRALAGDDSLCLRLAWTVEDPRQAITDNDVYADACGVLYPLDGVDAELATMGDSDRPVQAWFWRAGTAEPFTVTARGLGTAQRVEGSGLRAQGEWAAATWNVVFSRPLPAAGVPLARGREVPVGIAIWSGAAGERAGLKAHTPTWQRLRIE